jgi:triphosphatase
VRKEGRHWVQTLKGAGDGLWQRLEHEVPLQVAPGTAPQADPARHAGTPAGEALHAALGGGELQPLYRTEVIRTRRLMRARGVVAELAFDRGALVAGEQRWPLCEIEFELKSGRPAALAELAARWVERFGLTLDTRSKAERGERLARGVRLGAAVKAQPLQLPPSADAATALRAAVANCLRQVLGNASDLAHEAGADADQLHQLRVGLRRLRSVLRELGPLSPQLSPDWEDAAARLFRSLGSARDRDALASTLLPALHKAGAVGLQLPLQAELPPVHLVLREPATTRLWLHLLAFAAGDPADETTGGAAGGAAGGTASADRWARSPSADQRQRLLVHVGQHQRDAAGAAACGATAPSRPGPRCPSRSAGASRAPRARALAAPAPAAPRSCRPRRRTASRTARTPPRPAADRRRRAAAAR